MFFVYYYRMSPSFLAVKNPRNSSNPRLSFIGQYNCMTTSAHITVLCAGVSPIAIQAIIGTQVKSCEQSGVSDMPQRRNNLLVLMARIKMWFCLIWNTSAVRAAARPVHETVLNRAESRIKRRCVPIARRPSPLASILYRSFGRARYLRFLYDETLTGRVRWCFTKWNWKWCTRVYLKECLQARTAKHGNPHAVFYGTLVTLHPD